MGNPYLLARKMRLLTVCLCSMLLVLSQAAPLRRMGKGVILAKGDKTLAIDVYAGKTRTVGTKLHLWKVHKGRAQQLQFNKDGTITTTYGGLSLAVKGGKAKKGVQIVLAKKSAKSLRWRFIGEHICLKNAWLCLDAANGPKQKHNLILWSKYNGINQKWVVPKGFSKARRLASRRLGKGVIVAKGDKNLAIDVYAGKTRTVGTKLHLWKTHKGRAQQLTFNKDGTITTTYGGMSLAVKGGKVKKGVQIVLAKKTAKSLKWRFIGEHICLKNAWLCLDANNGPKQKHNIILWSKYNGINQKWVTPKGFTKA